MCLKMASSVKTRAHALLCKECKSTAKEGLKCILCGSLFHHSCVQSNKQIIFVEKNKITCCAKGEVKPDLKMDSEIEMEFWGAISEHNPDVPVKTMDIRIVNYIIKQKDCLIETLQSEVKVLREQFLDSKKPQKIQTSVDIDAKKTNETKSRPMLKTAGIPKNQDALAKHVTAKANNVNKVKVNELQAPDSITSKTNEKVDKKEDNTWIHVSRKKPTKAKKQNPIIIGNKLGADNSNIKAAPRKAYLYVTRLSNTTTQEALTTFLQKDVPEVACEELPNKYPSHFKRFKVTVHLENLKKILHPDVWPSGVEVTRFFHPRRKAIESN